MTKKMPSLRTEEEIAALAQDFLAGKVYAVDWTPEALVPMVFMPLIFGGLKGYSVDQLSRLFVFAVSGKDISAPRAVNGYPMFFSMQVWRRRDAMKAQERAKAAEAVLHEGEA